MVDPISFIKVMFLPVSVILFTGGSGRHPLGRYPLPQADTLSWQTHPLGRYPQADIPQADTTQADTPGQTPHGKTPSTVQNALLFSCSFWPNHFQMIFLHLTLLDLPLVAFKVQV